MLPRYRCGDVAETQKNRLLIGASLLCVARLAKSCPKSEKGNIRQEGRNMKNNKKGRKVSDLEVILIFTFLLVGLVLFF